MGKDETKPFEITVNGKLVWSRLEKVEGQTAVGGDDKPLLFENNKWWGDADPAWAAYIDSAINSA